MGKYPPHVHNVPWKYDTSVFGQINIKVQRAQGTLVYWLLLIVQPWSLEVSEEGKGRELLYAY